MARQKVTNYGSESIECKSIKISMIAWFWQDRTLGNTQSACRNDARSNVRPSAHRLTCLFSQGSYFTSQILSRISHERERNGTQAVRDRFRYVPPSHSLAARVLPLANRERGLWNSLFAGATVVSIASGLVHSF